jgi:hypothetical protein
MALNRPSHDEHSDRRHAKMNDAIFNSRWQWHLACEPAQIAPDPAQFRPSTAYVLKRAL